MTHTVVDLLPKDAIQSIDDPEYSSSFEGDKTDEVIVVEEEHTAHAYPTRILQNHEVVNDTFGGKEIAITWCPLCASAVVYERRLDGELLTFGVSGKLADNDLVLYDRETESEWKQSSGICLSGTHSGKSLTLVPAATMTWAAFEERFPDGEVLQPPEWGTADYGTDRFVEYMDSDYIGPGGGKRLRTTIEDWPFEFHPKTLTLGVTIDGDSRGYPRSIVTAAGGVVTDRVGGAELVVFATEAGIFAYERGSIQFEATADGNRFRGDGTVWDPATGQGDDGRALTRIPSRRLFAFTWRDDNGSESFYLTA